MNIINKIKEYLCSDCQSDFDKYIRDMARRKFEKGEDMPFLGVYVSDFGEHEIILLTKEQADSLR